MDKPMPRTLGSGSSARECTGRCCPRLSCVEASRLSGATQDEQLAAVATLVSAFQADPVERWLYPAEDDYAERFPQFVAAFGREAFAHDTVWQSGDFAGVALWLPPGAEPDGEEIVRVLMATTRRSRHGDITVALEQMEAAHPSFPHWYLPWFGVDATLQGKGLGAALMACCLDVVDDMGLPAYLETPNPRTISFYKRFGFQVTGSTQTKQCPPITFMLRRSEAE